MPGQTAQRSSVHETGGTPLACAIACLRNSAISLRDCCFRERSRPPTPDVSLAAMSRALCEPLAAGFLAGDLGEDRRRGTRAFPAAGRVEPSDLQRPVDGDHRRATRVDRVDDLGVVDALEVDG